MSEKILASIDRFVYERKYHYALLINGPWGCGKTFFVKQILIPHFSEFEGDRKRDINYISLYGIKTAEEINGILCAQAFRDKAPKSIQRKLEQKSGQITTGALSLVMKFVVNKIGFEKKDLESIIDLFANYENNIIIFDDLERCGCEINEVLGYINNFVEHSNASVILIANEEEIGKWELDRNPELQMLVAMNSNVAIPPDKDSAAHASQERHGEFTSKEEVNPEQVEKRRKALFNSNERYRRMKEKVIGMTINYEPDLQVVFRRLIEGCVSNELLRTELLERVDYFAMVAEENDHKNLRTFQYFLDKVSAIFGMIGNQYPDLHPSILEYTQYASIRYMKGMKLPEWDAEYGNQESNPGMLMNNHPIFGFKFIDDFIVNEELDQTVMHEILGRCNRMVEKKGRLNEDPFQQIENWYKVEDEQVEIWLKKIEENVKSGYYSTELYTELVHHLSTLKANHIMPERCDSIFAAMRYYIQNTDPALLDDLESEHFEHEGEDKIIYQDFIHTLHEDMKKAKAGIDKRYYEEAIKDKTRWASNLIKVMKSNKTGKDYSFIYWLEPAQIVGLIEQSNNYELNQFRIALRICHTSYTNKADDIFHLTGIRERLDVIDKSAWGQIKKAYFNLITKDINKYIEAIRLYAENQNEKTELEKISSESELR